MLQQTHMKKTYDIQDFINYPYNRDINSYIFIQYQTSQLLNTARINQNRSWTMTILTLIQILCRQVLSGV